MHFDSIGVVFIMFCCFFLTEVHFMWTWQGGILWFTDLTVPVQGALGALFPVIVAATYFTNLQVLFYIITGS